MKKHKTLGQVYTPDWIVNEILDFVGYNSKNILSRKIIDPASGDGAFLKVIVNRIIDEGINQKLSKQEIIDILTQNVYGIEIDKDEYNKCIFGLNEIIKNKLNTNSKVKWNIFNDNTLLIYNNYKSYFDYVVGNPPYIRIHNLDIKTRNLLKRNFLFARGTIDIYISFFELGIFILKKDGLLGYITPNSYLHNSSYKSFRKYLKDKKAINKIVDFKANKIFNNFSTYTAITILSFSDLKDEFEYFELLNDKIQLINKIKYTKLTDTDWSFSSNENMSFLNKLYSRDNYKVSDFFDVQYGFATLRDKIFIGNITEIKDKFALFNDFWIETQILFKIIKGSTYKGKSAEYKYIVFPYKKVNSRYIALTENELKEKYPNAYNYLLDNKKELIKRDIDKGSNWFEFGRSQGIQSMNNEKIVLSSLIKDKISYFLLPADVFVYSGIFIVKKDKTCNWDIIINILESDDFLKFIKITGKDFSGGYKSITTLQIKNFPTLKINNQKKIFD